MFFNLFRITSLLLVSTTFLFGCVAKPDSSNITDANLTALLIDPTSSSVSNNAYPESQNILNHALTRSSDGRQNTGVEKRDVCIKELSSLKLLSSEDYSRLISSFKEVSEINQLYKQIAATASPDSILLLKMGIASKTKVLCAKVRYNAVLSTESMLQKINGL